jgi:hypothetical protein
MQSGAGRDRRTLGSILEGDLQGSSLPSIGNALGFLELTDFEGFKKALAGLLQSASEKIRRLSLMRIDRMGLPVPGTELEEGISRENKGGNRDIAVNLLSRLDRYKNRDLSTEEMMSLSKSVDRDKRLGTAMALFGQKEFRHHAILNTLLRDPDPLVRSTAIQAAAFWKVNDACPVLIDMLSSPFYRQVFDSLVKIGEGAVEMLEQGYYRSGVEPKTLNRVTRILGRIESPEAQKALFAKIGYQIREVDEIALRALLVIKLMRQLCQKSWRLFDLQCSKSPGTWQPSLRSWTGEWGNLLKMQLRRK